MRRYVVVAGAHHAGSGKDYVTYHQGDTIESSTDLIARFPGKFALDSSDDEDEDEKPSEKKATKGKKKLRLKVGSKKKEKKPEVDPRGVDVTGDFTIAGKNKLTVFQKDDSFHVYNGDDIIDGGEGLSKADVSTAVTKFMEE